MCWIQFAFHASRSFISRSLFTHEFSFHLPLTRSPARCPCCCHRPFPLTTCAAERIHFFIFLFPTGDNYCNKLYKNKIAILARSNAACSMSNTWSRKKTTDPNNICFIAFLWDFKYVCVFFTVCRLHSAIHPAQHFFFERLTLNGINDDTCDTSDTWKKKYRALFLRNRKRSRDFSSIVVSHL